MPANADKCRRYRKKLKARCQALFGWTCQLCHAAQAACYAHREPTGLSGPGRGLTHRYLDILKNSAKYVRVCYECHRQMNPEDKYVPKAAA